MIWFVVSFFFLVSLLPSLCKQYYFVEKEGSDETKFMRINLSTFTS